MTKALIPQSDRKSEEKKIIYKMLRKNGKRCQKPSGSYIECIQVDFSNISLNSLKCYLNANW